MPGSKDPEGMPIPRAHGGVAGMAPCWRVQFSFKMTLSTVEMNHVTSNQSQSSSRLLEEDQDIKSHVPIKGIKS